MRDPVIGDPHSKAFFWWRSFSLESSSCKNLLETKGFSSMDSETEKALFWKALGRDLDVSWT